MSDPYCYPGTEVLRNHHGIVDAVELQRVEFARSLYRLLELNQRRLDGNYDLAHLQAFHRHLFGDVYPWAGELRTVDIVRGESRFAAARYLRDAAANVFAALARQQFLQGLTREQFVARSAELLGDVNALHPFREGNGRTQRAFLSQLAGDAGWHIRWSRVSAGENIEASIASLAGDNTPMAQLLARSVIARPAEAATPGIGPHERHQQHEQLYPQPGAPRPIEGLPPPQP
ncbi:MAG TPA: Fic family protein [Acidimicrobiales bacterium]|nr:Fic family protein [Acidimicrobiales bacterium]